MARDGLFSDLPPLSNPSNADATAPPSAPKPPAIKLLPEAPKPAIKHQFETNDHEEGAKKVRFKTTMDASAPQIADAMRKIVAHIGNASKFSKAFKLAMQLLKSESLNNDTSDLFFDILKAAMASPASATMPPHRQEYYELFSAVSEQLECFNPLQQAHLEVWFLWAQVANNFFTDDSFVFSKAANKVKQIISSLPEATAAEDVVDTASESQMNAPPAKAHQGLEAVEGFPNSAPTDEVDSDPFGLNALLSKPSRKEEKLSKRKEEEAASRKVQEHQAKLLQERQEALMSCLEIAAGRYKLKWAQTIIDILVKHAFDNVSKFTAQQRLVIEKLWSSVKEQQIRRKQGKSATGKLDVTGFERLQNQYSQAKISIRHSVGADGDRSAEQWLG